MDCAQLRQQMLGGGDLASPEAKQHLGECQACQILFAGDSDLPRLLAALQATRAQPQTPSFDEIAARISRESTWRARLAALPSSLRWLLALAALLFPVGVGIAKHRHDLGGYPPLRLAIELGALAGLALASCSFWLRPLYRRQATHRTLWAVLALALAVPWVLAALPAALPSPSGLAGSELHGAIVCFTFGTLTALPAFIVVAGLGRRQSALPGFAALPALAGALAGLVGLEIHCPNASPTHLLAGHAPLALVLPVLTQIAVLLRRPTSPWGTGED